MKRSTAIILVLFLIAGMAVLAYFMSVSRKALLSDPYKAVSSTAVLIIESPDLKSFMNLVTSGKGLPGELEKIKEFSSFNTQIRYFTDQLNKPGFNPLIGASPSLISFFYSEGSGLRPLLSLAAPGELRFKQLKSLFRTSGITGINESEIRGNRVLELPLNIKDSNDTLYATIVSGLFLCSTSGSVMGNAISQTELGNDIMTQSGFLGIHQAAGKKEDKIFIQFKRLKPLLVNGFKADADGLISEIEKLAGFFEGDIYLDDKGLILAGYAETTDSTDFLYRFKSAKAGMFHTFRVLPSSTVLFETLIMPDNIKPSSGNGSVAEAYDLATSISPYLGEEVTKAIVDIKGSENEENTIIVYELKDRVFAEKVFLERLTQAQGNRNIDWFRPDDQISIPVYQTGYRGFISAFFPGFAKGFNDTCFVFYDNFMITGNSFSTISKFLYDNILNKTLANDIAFREFESTLPSVASYYFFCIPAGITGYISKSFSENLMSLIKNNQGSLDRVQALGLQLISSNQMIYSTLSLKFTQEARERSRTEWETKLDTVASIKPFFFTNHTTGAREIFIQDLKNNAYLINSAGRVLWKVPLNERINGQVYSIDYFRNGKFQLLFAGRNYLHLIDRNGNYVERYPVRLRSPSTSPLALFDYDNNRDYRLLIAGEDKTIYAYDKTGSTVKGWKSFKANGLVSSEINWFRVSGKDFLVVSDEKSVYLLDRTGSIRLNLKEPVIKARNSQVRLSSGSGQSIVCSAPDGTVQHINFDGSVSRFSFQSFSIDHSFDFFDVDGDGFGEYIFIDNGMLYLYDHNRTGMFKKDFGSARLGGPICFTFSSGDREVGVFDVDKKLIYLISKEGNIMKGFPLRGASMFSIGKMSEGNDWNLIVGGTDNFLYNYNLNAEF